MKAQKEGVASAVQRRRGDREGPAGEVSGKGTRIRHNIPPELRCSITSGERAPRRDPYNSKISAEGVGERAPYVPIRPFAPFVLFIHCRFRCLNY